MTAKLTDVLAAANKLLRPDDFRDYCPNGLQIEGKPVVGKIISGVTASQALIDAAVAAGADAILVHHGFFWKGEGQALTGIKRQRIKTLLENDVSLLAYHLPLDAHPKVGNNARLALKLGFTVVGQLDPVHKSRVGVFGRPDSPVEGEELARHIASVLGREPFHVPGASKRIETIAWCTGAAQQYIEDAYERGADAYLTGEVSEQTVHFARETGMHFYAAGHHATERYGVQALGEYLARECGVVHDFIDIDNPV